MFDSVLLNKSNRCAYFYNWKEINMNVYSSANRFIVYIHKHLQHFTLQKFLGSW